MLSSRTLFLGVYTADGILRRLFLPLCYLLLCSPFALLASRYFGFHHRLLEYIPKDYKTPDIWPQVFVALVTVFLATRIISGSSNGTSKDGRKRRIQLLPFWVPGLRHWVNLVFGGEVWLKRVRDTSVTNVVAYNYSGTKHNVVLSAALLEQILGNSNSLEEADLTKWITLCNAYGLPQRGKRQYLQLRPAISETLVSEIFVGKKLKSISSAFLDSLSEALPDLVTFNSSIVDQLPWERVAGIELTSGTEEVECDFFALINEFLCRAMIPLITGPQFPESYELLASDLATFNQSFYVLALGLPRFFPLAGLPGAKLARKRLLQNLTRLFRELNKPATRRDIPEDESVSGEETDADTPTPLTALNKVFSEHDIPLQARAAIALELLHKLVSKAVPLAFWTIVHIYKESFPAPGATHEQDISQTPVSKIRNETRPWARAIQPPSIHPSFPSPPEITFSTLTPLFNPSSHPYLRSCIFESRRLYEASITTAKVTKPIIFTDPSTPGGGKEEWQLDAGSYLDIGLSQRLINTSAAEYLSPAEYKPFRSTRSPTLLSSSIFDNSEELVSAMVMAFVAGVTQLWDIHAAPKNGFFEQIEVMSRAAGGTRPEITAERHQVWIVPKAVDGASVMLPKRDIRVRIRRREGLEKGKSRGQH